MTCRSNECEQGRKVCPTPGYCADIGYEAGYLPRDQADNLRGNHARESMPLPIMYAERDEPEDPAPPVLPSVVWLILAVLLVYGLYLGLS